MTQGSYKQFCPVAMAAEILCTRWTIVLIRELVTGSTRFNDLRRGVPRMSLALLSQRLKELERAKAKAEHASERDRCYENVEVVRALVEVANEQFGAGDADQAQKTVKETATYADRAREASQHSGHKLKQAEITLRKAQRRLDDLRHTLTFEDQGPVEAVLKQLEVDRLIVKKELIVSDTGLPWEKGFEAHQIPRGIYAKSLAQ